MTTDATALLTSFAADLTDAAYAVALHHGVGGSWIDLQLDVWRVLAGVISQSHAALSDRGPNFEAWREALLSRATDAAYRTVLRHNVRGSFLDVELDLQRALRRVIESNGSQFRLEILRPGARV